MPLLTALRIVLVVTWGALFVFMVPGAVGALRKQTRRGDPMRLGVLVTAFVMVGFSLRWLLAPDSEALWVALYCLSLADAVFIWRLARAYGRGPHV